MAIFYGVVCNRQYCDWSELIPLGGSSYKSDAEEIRQQAINKYNEYCKDYTNVDTQRIDILSKFLSSTTLKINTKIHPRDLNSAYKCIYPTTNIAEHCLKYDYPNCSVRDFPTLPEYPPQPPNCGSEYEIDILEFNYNE